MWRLYKYLRWIWVGLIAGVIVLPLTRECVTGLIAGKGCNLWKPTLNFVDTYLLWITLFLMVLVAATLLARESNRRHQASNSFDLFKPANKLLPTDIGFRIATPEEDAQLEDYSALNLHPFYESTYINRLTVLYEERENPGDHYDEGHLIDSLRKGRGFILIGRPEDGKTRTLYEILRHMDDYEIISLKSDAKVLDKPDLTLLFKNSKLILLLDDLSNVRNSESDLLDLTQRLTECEIPWAVASTCQDAAELTRARTRFRELYYDNRNLKLWLVEATPQQKKQLAENIWNRPWNPAKSDDYPTLGSIAMREAMLEMKKRFSMVADDNPERADLLRALKLLDYAGVPSTYDRLRAVLGHERLFHRSDFDLLKSLEALADQGFLRLGSTDPVQAEGAYLRSAVTYAAGRKPEDDLDTLADVLEEWQDSDGLFYLSTTCADTLEAYERAVTYYDRVLHLKPNFIGPLLGKSMALNNLGHHEEALEALSAALEIEPDSYEAFSNAAIILGGQRRFEEALEAANAALEIRPDSYEALGNKGVVLSNLGRYEEALEALNEILKVRPDSYETLVNKGAILTNLGRNLEALRVLERVLKMRPDSYQALSNKAGVLTNLERYDEALEAVDAVLEVQPDSYQAFSNKGRVLSRLGRYLEALKAYNDALEIQPNEPMIIANIGIALEALKRYEEALEAYNAALEIQPNYPHVMLGVLRMKGDTLQTLERYEEALKAYNTALEMNPNDTRVLRSKGDALNNLGRQEEAQEAYNEADRLFQIQANQ